MPEASAKKDLPAAASSLPSSIRHSHTLPDGRGLAYYTFSSGVEDTQLQSHHPVLYFHGFPGSGVEGTICANAAIRANCQLFGIDRPGFGHSSPSPGGSADWDDPGAYMQCFVSDVWDFVRAKRWESLSIIGVSGGGPFALAMLDSYLKSKLASKDDAKGPANSCRLEALTVVCGIFCSAGSRGMMESNKKLVSIASLRGWKSSVAYFGLLVLLTLQRFILLQILLRFFSQKRLLEMASNMTALPEVDRNIFTDDEAVGRAFLNDAKEALRQGSGPFTREAKVVFNNAGFYFERSLRDNFAMMKIAAQTKNGRNQRQDTSIPRVSIFHGHLDVNVPPSHSRYVHENVLGGGGNLTEFANMGHLSLVVKKADAILESAARK